MSLWAKRTRSLGGPPSIHGSLTAKGSVDRRLLVLLLGDLFAAAVVSITALFALGRLASERAYVDRYVFAPLVDIGQAQASVDELDQLLLQAPTDAAASARGPILRLRQFLERYQRDWETGPSMLPDAVRLRAELERQGEMNLVEKEHEAVGRSMLALHDLEITTGLLGSAPADPPLQRSDVATVGSGLVSLNLINLRYVQVAYKAFERTHALVTAVFFVVNLGGLVAAALFGLSFRRAIGPRVHRMVHAIDHFRERGVPDPIDDAGDDDLAMLARTLDLSCKSIAERDKERERFLAVAAHELKTPLTTLKGFAQVALAHPDEPAVRTRALAVVDRQATRLGRLVQDLLWSARAGAGQLPFNPAPVDLAVLTRRVIGDVALMQCGHDIHLRSQGDPHVLGDVGLLEHSLWNLITGIVSLASDHVPVEISIEGAPARARISVETASGAHLPDDLDELCEPFMSPPYERPNGWLSGTGLGFYLVREIARVHGATFNLKRNAASGIAASLELRR